MSRSDLVLVILNSGLLVASLLAFASTEVNVLMSVALATMVVAAINVGVQVRRRSSAPSPQRDPEPTRPHALDVDLDARQILDLDARLERLEQAHADATDAAKWRSLVESGQVSGPGLPDDGASQPAKGHTRNGRH